jgi:GNAT superfamily N-acetyltransferase
VIFPHEENVAILIDAWKLLVQRLPGNRIEIADGVASMLANVPLAFFNMCASDHPIPDPAEMQRVLGVCKERIESCPHESFTGLCEAWLPENWQRISAEFGFAPALGITGMLAPELTPARRPAPDLEFRRVSDPATARDIAEINRAAYEMAPGMCDAIAGMHLWTGGSCAFVGYMDGRGVTAAAVFPLPQTLYVAMVATMPGEHGKGYAEAVMRHAITQAGREFGKRPISLHATEMGQPLYASMGFEAGSRIVLLARARADN